MKVEVQAFEAVVETSKTSAAAEVNVAKGATVASAADVATSQRKVVHAKSSRHVSTRAAERSAANLFNSVTPARPSPSTAEAAAAALFAECNPSTGDRRSPALNLCPAFGSAASAKSRSGNPFGGPPNSEAQSVLPVLLVDELFHSAVGSRTQPSSM